MDKDKIEQLAKWVKESSNIVFFTGAGVSTASGIPDFRGAKGLYKEVPERIVSHSYFYSNTKDFYDFYWDKMVFLDAFPNMAHLAMAKLEKMGKCLGVVTQNIDLLHQNAGSTTVPIHGTIENYLCSNCGHIEHIYNMEVSGIPKCKKCNHILKPDVVLYEEPLDYDSVNKAISMISSADMLIVCGTSLVVYPAASFIKYFKGDKLVIINLDCTQYDEIANLHIFGRVEDVLAQILTKIQ